MSTKNIGMGNGKTELLVIIALLWGECKSFANLVQKLFNSSTMMVIERVLMRMIEWKDIEFF